jgi:hypothetical protein
MRPVDVTPTKKEGRTTMVSSKTAQGENPALSYRNLRAIIGYVGLTLPVVLLLAGLVDGHIESSISAYYYTKVGNVFTGALWVIGIFLLAYRLTSWAIDNIATTLAGISALGVAFFHAAPSNATLDQLRLANVHLTCAAALFILLGAISLFIFPKDMSSGQRHEKLRVACYRGLGALIWLSIILMPTLNMLAGTFYDNNHVFFTLETICVMAFAVSFILKGHGQPSTPDFDTTAAEHKGYGQPSNLDFDTAAEHEGYGQPSNPDVDKTVAEQPPPAAICPPVDGDTVITGTSPQHAGQR